MIWYGLLLGLLLSSPVFVVLLIYSRFDYTVTPLFFRLIDMYIIRIMLILFLFGVMFFTPLSLWVE